MRVDQRRQAGVGVVTGDTNPLAKLAELRRGVVTNGPTVVEPRADFARQFARIRKIRELFRQCFAWRIGFENADPRILGRSEQSPQLDQLDAVDVVATRQRVENRPQRTIEMRYQATTTHEHTIGFLVARSVRAQGCFVVVGPKLFDHRAPEVGGGASTDQPQQHPQLERIGRGAGNSCFRIDCSPSCCPKRAS